LLLFAVILSVIAGTLVSAAIAILPGLHVYNLLGLIMLLVYGGQGVGIAVDPELFLSFAVGLVCGWAMLNTIPSVVLGAPDESAIFTVLPGQKYLMSGRGHEGVMIIGTGGLAGVVLLLFVMGPLAPKFLPVAKQVLMPHMHWILWVIITFILMSEWPKRGNLGSSGWLKFFDAWKGLGAGLLTFFLAGWLGFILLYRSPVSASAAFQNIMPAFVGLFAVPWCLLNMVSGVEVPEQKEGPALGINGAIILRSAVAGGLGGGFAAFCPVVTGGVGGLLAGHATAQRDERVFMMSQGVSKMVYYSGALLLFFAPGLNLTRGGGAWMVKGFYEPQGWGDYLLVLGCIALSGALSFLLLSPLARFVLWLSKRIHYRTLSAIALLIMLVLVVAITGWPGVALMLVGAGIGLIPVLFGSRRLNCLGVLLLPMACNLSGFGPVVAAFLGLV
jgi:putative membrane protein